jgi:hypothetical protein
VSMPLGDAESFKFGVRELAGLYAFCLRTHHSEL